MLSEQTVAVIGAGNIGRALIGGLLSGTPLDADRIRATRRDADALAHLDKKFPGIHTGTDNVQAVRGATVVILAIKPFQARDVVEQIRPHLGSGTMVISVLAGVTIDALSRVFGKEAPIVRAMPNTPALVDEAATAIALGDLVGDDQAAVAREVFEAVGKVEVVSEHMMDAVTGLSGSGPAYVYMVIEALTDGGVKQGLPRPVALRLAAQTVFGAAKLVIETGQHPAILRDEVTTPGGTAIAAVANLESHGLRTMLINAVGAASKRSEELSHRLDD